MIKPKLPCGIHFCPVPMRLLWPIKAIRIIEIASVYGVGIPETTRRAERLKIADQRKRRREPRYSQVEFRKLWADESLRVRDIAAHFGLLTRVVEAHAVRMQLPQRRKGQPRIYAFPADFAEMWAAGVPAKEIAEIVGCCLALVSTEARRRKLPRRKKCRGGKVPMLAYQMEKSAKDERAQWAVAEMVDRLWAKKDTTNSTPGVQ